jgi:AraC-like DNA-binding protein
MKEIVNRLVALKFQRPFSDIAFDRSDSTELTLSGLPAWRSNGGPTRAHPARSFPFTLEASFDRGQVVRIHLVGVFAQFAGPSLEVPGALGASLQLYSQEELIYHHPLTNGLHYSDAALLEREIRTLGDGSTVAPIGRATIDGVEYRVDELTLDVPTLSEVDHFKFRSSTSPASFVIFDAFVEMAVHHGCPFHSAGGGVPLARIGAIVRLGDRVEFVKALSQLEDGVLSAPDLDESRGLALTFLAVLTAALLEIGGSKKLVLEQLSAARCLEPAKTREEIWEIVLGRIEVLTPNLLNGAAAYSDRLVDKALAYIDRNFAKPISDATIAKYLGLSTSHFRFLFKQATGQPFHQYLIASRLEKAHLMLVGIEGSTVGSVAKAVGFIGISHFSRAFRQRFNVSPASVRKNNAGYA